MEVIQLLSDDELANYLPLKGHRVLVRQYCNQSKSESRVASSSSDLHDRLKQNMRGLRSLKKQCDTKPGPKPKADRPIEMGLCKYDHKRQDYVKVTKAHNGSIRYIRLPKECKKRDVLLEGKKLFNIDEPIEKLELSLDVKGYKLVEESTDVETIYSKLKMKSIRFYVLWTPDVSGLLLKFSDYFHLLASVGLSVHLSILPSFRPSECHFRMICQFQMSSYSVKCHFRVTKLLKN